MKKVLGIAALFAAVLILGMWACEPPNGSSNPSAPSSHPTNTSTPTPPGTVTPVNTPTATSTILPATSTYTNATIAVTVVQGAGDTYTPSSDPGGTIANLSITHGQAIVFNNLSGHTVEIDDGTGTGTCSANYTSFPVTLTFPSPATFYFHCTEPGHATCPASPSCSSSCTGMVGSVTVN